MATIIPLFPDRKTQTPCRAEILDPSDGQNPMVLFDALLPRDLANRFLQDVAAFEANRHA